MTHTVDFISTHPLLSLFIMLSIHFGASVAIYELTLPLIIMQLLQCFAWTVTSIVGSITVYKYFKKKR